MATVRILLVAVVTLFDSLDESVAALGNGAIRGAGALIIVATSVVALLSRVEDSVTTLCVAVAVPVAVAVAVAVAVPVTIAVPVAVVGCLGSNSVVGSAIVPVTTTGGYE